jgi:HK97 family phage major capsid protein
LKLADGPAVITKSRRYSLLKAIGMSLSDPNAGDVGLERELHQEMSRDKAPRGVMVPLTAIFATKDGQSTLTSGAGGALATTDQLMVSLLSDVDAALRLNSVIGPLGISTLTVPATQKIRIPVVTQGSRAAFIGRDSAAPLLQDLEFTDRESTPKTLAIGAKLLRSSLIYSVPAMEGVVRSDISIALTDAINTALIASTGVSNDPIGIVPTLQTASRDFTGELAASPTLKKLLDFSDTHIESYAENGNKRAWLGHPKTFDTYRTTPAWTGSLGLAIMSGSTIEDDPVVESHRCVFGSGSTPSEPFIAYGDWAEVFWITYGPGLDLLPNPYESSVYLAGGILLRGLMDLDIAYRDVKRLAMASDVVS